MSRAKRYFLPGYVWHITNRCLNREYLLKFLHDKRRFLYWLYLAKKKHDISILNYAVTSNHIHLLLTNSGRENCIPKVMQLVTSRVAQEYNMRKKRIGPFWQDRYHATAIESGTHLINCMIYIDFNMVRAGVVKHPREYPFCGYQEIVGRKMRNCLIDKEKLGQLLGVEICHLNRLYEDEIGKYLERAEQGREEKWTTSLAVGSKAFVENFKLKMKIKAKNRDIEVVNGLDNTYVLREPKNSYF